MSDRTWPEDDHDETPDAAGTPDAQAPDEVRPHDWFHADEPRTELLPAVPVTAEPDPEPEPEQVVPRRSRRGTAAVVAVRTLVALVSVGALTGTGVAWTRINQIQDSVNTTDVIAQVGAAPDAPTADDGANDILFVGSDTRTDMQGRPLSQKQLKELRTEESDGLNTDTIILLRIPRNGAKSYAVSIPRDTYVTIPGYQDDKINSAYGVSKYRAEQKLREQGETDRTKVEQQSNLVGQSVLVQSVQNLTGVRIDHYAEISLYGFYLLTEAVGGVEVCLNHSTSDPDSGADFGRGRQTVSGGDAVAFVRQRKNLPRGDLDRIVRQQTFLAAAMRKVLSAGTLANPAKLDALAEAVNKSVVTDGGLKFIELLEQARSLASGNVAFVTIPVTDINGHNDRGQSVVTVDVPQVKSYVATLATGGPSGLRGSAPLSLNGPARTQNAEPGGVPCVD